jgi:hypothetical protein
VRSSLLLSFSSSARPFDKTDCIRREKQRLVGGLLLTRLHLILASLTHPPKDDQQGGDLRSDECADTLLYIIRYAQDIQYKEDEYDSYVSLIIR